MNTAELATLLADRFESLAVELRAAQPARISAAAPNPATSATTSPAGAPVSSAGRTKAWSEIVDLAGQKYKWPNEPTENYTKFPVFETADARGTAQISIGYADQAAIDRSSRKRPYLVTFEIVGQKMVRPLVVFTATDDHASTGDFVGVIKGKGNGGKKMFAPGDILPPAYAGWDIVLFRDKVDGAYSYNKLAVLARGGDVDAILDHALIQLRLRFS
jgi:hypothetical protein